MSWLRIDDGFARHPKFAGWPAARRWAWMELLCDCAQRDTSGYVSDDLSLLPRAVTKSLLNHAEKAGLLDRGSDNRLRVHDWLIYNGTVEEKVATYLGDHPDASANDVHRAVGGRREAILEAVRAYHETGSQPGSRAGSRAGTQEPNGVVPEAVHARASPSPAPAPNGKPKAVEDDARAPDPGTAEVEELDPADQDIDFDIPLDNLDDYDLTKGIAG